ncbi:GNAT family N-acetyltransferase [Dermacoccus sp. 147Ba]|uniref:GNAT family N-acetyltransferase n=1 Tax=Dermacoccus sp. 147Ba TaxID=2510111 RepID=UPI00101D88DF|nr:GNAT family N-acetyltransferase [Dermacoccus sp. 147Ba]RYI24251.1 GNAT family N-acetyltransferase [Dermacoccus sp. 147Ba]
MSDKDHTATGGPTAPSGVEPVDRGSGLQFRFVGPGDDISFIAQKASAVTGVNYQVETFREYFVDPGRATPLNIPEQPTPFAMYTAKTFILGAFRAGSSRPEAFAMCCPPPLIGDRSVEYALSGEADPLLLQEVATMLSDVTYLLGFWVDPEERRQGVGSQLFQELERRVGEGLSSIMFGHAGSLGAERFFQQMGCTVLARGGVVVSSSYWPTPMHPDVTKPDQRVFYKVIGNFESRAVMHVGEIQDCTLLPVPSDSVGITFGCDPERVRDVPQELMVPLDFPWNSGDRKMTALVFEGEESFLLLESFS